MQHPGRPMLYLVNMAMLHGYVKLPDGIQMVNIVLLLYLFSERSHHPTDQFFGDSESAALLRHFPALAYLAGKFKYVPIGIFW